MRKAQSYIFVVVLYPLDVTSSRVQLTWTRNCPDHYSRQITGISSGFRWDLLCNEPQIESIVEELIVIRWY